MGTNFRFINIYLVGCLKLFRELDAGLAGRDNKELLVMPLTSTARTEPLNFTVMYYITAQGKHHICCDSVETTNR